MRIGDIGRNILILDKYFKLFLKEELKEYEINTAESMVLLTLYGQNGQTSEQLLKDIHHKKFSTTQDKIIDELHYDKGVMTRTMQNLESKGFVAREDNPLDSRSFIFSLTERAENFKPMLISVLKKWSDFLLMGLDDKTLEMLDTALSNMVKNVINLSNKGDKK